MEKPTEAELKKQNQKCLLVITLLVFINALLETWLDYQSYLSNFFKYFIGVTFWGFMIGLLMALLPYKNLSYNKRYLSISLFTLIVMHLICMAMTIGGAVIRFFF